MDIDNLDKKTLAAIAMEIKRRDRKGGTRVAFDASIPENRRKLDVFEKNADQRYVNDEYGVISLVKWDDEYGFVLIQDISDAFVMVDETRILSYEEKIAVLKEQIKVVKKARRNLACMIRLKERLGLPGPIQEMIHREGENGYGAYCTEFTKEQIDHILKY